MTAMAACPASRAGAAKSSEAISKAVMVKRLGNKGFPALDEELQTGCHGCRRYLHVCTLRPWRLWRGRPDLPGSRQGVARSKLGAQTEQTMASASTSLTRLA